jgi:hypothetical protein
MSLGVVRVCRDRTPRILFRVLVQRFALVFVRVELAAIDGVVRGLYEPFVTIRIRGDLSLSETTSKDDRSGHDGDQFHSSLQQGGMGGWYYPTGS